MVIFDKHKFRKINDKKALHKIGKNWAVASVVILDLIATGGFTKQIYADTTNQSRSNQKTNKIASSLLAHQNLQDYANATFNRYGKNNEAYNTSKNSFTNVDSFLTANSWYRPKMIHRNGKNWTASQQKDANDHHDFRPILMNWWPDKNTEVNYLNYMQNQGIIAGNYHTSDSQNHLDQAAHNVQDNLEHNISSNHSYLTNYVKPLFANFASTQKQWNWHSEDHFHGMSLQDGQFAFINSHYIPQTNSNYRLWSRDGSTQDRTHPNHNNLEFVSANDVDNSNPKVQAEDLNNMYYINNVGRILNNNSQGNFDGFREDATGSMDYDITDILSRYMKDKYHSNNDKNADHHLTIMEDGPSYSTSTSKQNKEQALTQDEAFVQELNTTLLSSPGNRNGDLNNLFSYQSNNNGKPGSENHYPDRYNDYSVDSRYNHNIIPNYSRINYHDNSDLVGFAIPHIMKQINVNNPRLSSWDNMYRATQVYEREMSNTTKGYHQYYNLPAAYALLLSNKDTVPEVYYGDMYNASAPYMSTHTPYFDSIQSLLESRKKYASGGQQMRSYGNDLISSVRFGKNNYQPNDHNSKTSGEVSVINNNPNYRPQNDLKVFVGNAHRNQNYRPVLLSKQKQIQSFNVNDSIAGDRYAQLNNDVLKVDSNGYLDIPHQYLNGISNPQVSGNLSVWVPMGAKNNQDARTVASSTPSKDGMEYHSNAALDSHVLYEGFSSFQPMANGSKQSLDKVIVKSNNVKALNDWGITDFRFPPHYYSVKNDNSFMDADNHNGYALEDRYDLGNGHSTKYGNVNDLIKANTALHQSGIHTLADLVENQLYDLPQKEVTPIKRVDSYGNYLKDGINGQLYLDNTISSPRELQIKYGGSFLSQMLKQSKYNDLFTTKQVSTGESIDPNTEIKQWSAKYMNGSKVQNYGIDYVLKDKNNHYYKLSGNKYIPISLTNAKRVKSSFTIFNFTYNGYKLSSVGKSGSKSFNADTLSVPKGYQLVHPKQRLKYDNHIHDIAIRPVQVSDTINYRYNGKIVNNQNVVGNTWQSKGQYTAFDYHDHQLNVPKGYHIVQPNNWIAYDGGEHNISIWKNNKSLSQATSTVHYMYGNRDLGKEKFSGNAWSTGAKGDAFQIKHQKLNVPKGYHVIQPKHWIAYDGQNHNIAIWKNGKPLTQATDILNYQNNQNWLGRQPMTGNAWSTGANRIAFQTNSQNLNPPAGYQIANPEQWIAFDGKEHTVNMASQDKTTVDYMYNNHLVGSHNFTGNRWGTTGATNTAFQVGLTPHGLSNQYETEDPDQWIAFDGNSHQINVLPKAKPNQSTSVDFKNHGQHQIQNQTHDNQNSTLTAQEKQYLVNDQVYDNNSFTRQNGFLTADSWYRPKMIHQNGKNWVPSRASDYRPIIMNWWPDQNTRNAYVNYMNEHLKKDGFTPQKNYDQTQLKSVYHNLNQIQDNLEKGTSKYGLNWLRRLTDDFVATQPQWNRTSESPVNDNRQGGYMKFNNSNLTSNVNSNYRAIGRSTTMQDRLQDNNQNAEFLLGNDIDNSNPKVLAEDLNHIYYLNNIGSIMHDNHNLADPGNFDGMREDATGSMNYDVTDILSQYMKDRNHMVNDQNADNHLNILEDAQQFKQNIRHNEALHQDEGMLFNLRPSLLYPTNQRNVGLNILGGNDNNDLNFYHVDDTSDYNSDNANPNYSRVNLHDNDDFVKPITSMYKQTLSNHPHMDSVQAVKQAVNDFNNGMYSTNKPLGEYYNLPAAYAYLLTNKDTVPQVYYGDLYRGDKPYMSTKTPYYDSITTLLKNRIKYVAGGQQMATHTAGNASYVSSVRFGKIMSGDLKGQQISAKDQYSKQSGFKPSTSGIATVIGNQPNAQPNGSITVEMGANHANQRYQPLLLSTQDGIDTKSSRNIQLSTNNQGQLVIPQEYLQGVSNPQVSGNLSVWAPVGAKDNQDIRTPASQDTHTDDNVYHQNPALDSHVLYESFSPFMPINAPKSQQLDSVIAGKVPKTNEDTSQWIKNLGLTDFRFPPHYSPIKHDNSFLDAIDQNGYSFEDRYDMNHTKYGNLTDMLRANGRLHQDGIHTIPDLVLNQIYDLPKSEVVSATRTDAFGNPVNSSQPHLYKDQTVSSSNDLQAKYGGRYLKILQTLYPDLFNNKQIATNRRIDSSKSIKQWSGKYMNGSNLQNTGSGNILKNQQNGQYYSNGKFPTIFKFSKQNNRHN